MRRSALAASVAMVAMTATVPAWAQASEQSGVPADSIAAGEPAAAEASTGDIVVTAQRRAERLEDVPISIANFNAAALSNANVQSLSEVEKLTSGVRFDKRASFVVPTIRGITTNIVLAGGGSNIGVYLDGFYSPSLQGSDIQLLNVESVQILKGPQGTLFGRNTNGGAIQVNTAEPNDRSRFVGEVGYGSYDAFRLQGYGNLALDERTFLDVGASYSSGDGYTTNIANGDDKVGRYRNFSLRTALKVQLSDNFSVVARYARSDLNDPTNLLQVPYVLNGRVAAQFAYLPGAVVTTRRKEVSADEPFLFRFKSDAYQFKAALDLDPFTLTSYTQWRKDRQLHARYSLDYTNLPGLGIDIPDYNDTFTQELLVTSHAGPRLQYTVGAFYFNANQRFPGVLLAAGRNPFTFSSASGVRNKSIAGYADLTYDLGGGLFVTGGLRYTRDTVDDAFFTVGAARTTTTLPQLKTSRLTPRAVVRYEFTPDTNVYASYSRGYKAAIYNVGGLVRDVIKPEELDAFEVGLKHNAGGLRANVAGWYYSYRQQQIVAGVLVNGIPVSRITNAASSKMYGLDADVAYRVARGLDLSASVAFSHNRYDDFPKAPLVVQNANNGFATLTQDASGFRMLRSPDFSGNVGATYETGLADGRLVLSGNLYYTSSFFFDAGNQFRQSAYHTLGLRAEWTDPSDRYTFAVSGKNVTDERYYNQVASNALGVAAVWAPPAMVEASFRVKLGQR